MWFARSYTNKQANKQKAGVGWGVTTYAIAFCFDAPNALRATANDVAFKKLVNNANEQMIYIL